MFPVVEIVRYVPGEVDAYGKKKGGYLPPARVDASFAPGDSSEPRDGLVNRVESKAQLVLKNPIQVDTRDYFLVDGRKYQADGEANTWHGHFSRRLFGQIIYLRRLDNE